MVLSNEENFWFNGLDLILSNFSHAFLTKFKNSKFSFLFTISNSVLFKFLSQFIFLSLFQIFSQFDLLTVFKSSTDHADHNLQKIVLNTFYNISTLGSVEQIKVLLGLDLLQLLCRQLNSQVNMHEDILQVSLPDCVTNLRKFKQFP